MALNEQIVEETRYYRQCVDKDNKKWERYGLWNRGKDTECEDGNTVETKVGAIKGITTSTNVSETGYAADAKTVSEINQSLTNLPRFEKINFTISNSSETVIDYPDGFNKDNTSVLSLIIKTSDVTYNQIPIFNQNASYHGNSFMNQSVFYKDDGIHFYNAQSTYRGKSAVVRVMRF